MYFDFDTGNIAGDKNYSAYLLSRLVKNHMKDHPDKFEKKKSLALVNRFVLPDGAYLKILKVYKSLWGHTD